MKKLIRIVGYTAIAAIMVAAGLFTAQSVFAQTPTPPTEPTPGQGYGPRGGYHMGGYGLMHGDMHTALADALGLTLDEFEARLADGYTMWEIAEQQGVDADELWAVMDEARAESIQELVEDGIITQEQADWMLSRPHGGPNGDGCRGGGRWGGGPQGGGRGPNTSQW